MMSLFSLYKWTIVAGALAAPALALLGVQLATRDRAMQTLCVGQGAMVGVLAGIGFLHSFEGTPLGAIGPLGCAVLLSAITIIATDRLVAGRMASRNTLFAFVFAFLLGAGSLVSAAFPALESHMAQVYFGDLATLTIFDSQVTSLVSLLCLTVLAVLAKSVSNQSFELAIFGNLVSSAGDRRGTWAFKIITLVMLSLSVQFLGFLFTIAMLFLPTSLMSFVSSKGLKAHFILCALVSIASALIGFVLSLNYTRLPTVPAIVMVMFLLSVVILSGERLYRFVARAGEASRSLLDPQPITATNGT